MVSKERFSEIDILRGIAMVGMILIHTSYYFLSNKIALSVWNYAQFAVPVFIFCSAFLYFQKTPHFHTVSDFLVYCKKRFLRLLMPYYIFAVFFFLAIFIFEQTKLTMNYILQSVFVIGGIDISWLVLLFLQLTIILPCVTFLSKQKKLLYVISALPVVFSAFLLFNHFPYNYKFIMWLPWALICLYAFFFVTYIQKKKFTLFVLFISLTLFIVCRFALGGEGKSLSFYDNKYPPNLYILMYGVFSTQILFLLAKHNVFEVFWIKRLLVFLSKFSYSIFFIHYFFLYVFVKTLPLKNLTWVTFFLLVFGVSLLTQCAVNFLGRGGFLHRLQVQKFLRLKS